MTNSKHGGKRAGAGAPKKSDKKIMISKRVTREVKDHLSALAKQADVTETEALQRAVLKTKKV